MDGRRMGALLVAAWSLAVASCSDGDGDADETTVAPVTEQPVTSAALETVPPITEPPVTTTSTTTTTIAPTTTFDPAEELARQVEADFLEAERLRIEAAMDPTDEAKRATALDARIGENRDALVETLDGLVANNYAIRENPDVEARNIIEVPARLVDGATDVAELQRCEIDPWVVIEIGAGPGGSDAIVNDEIYAYRNRVRLRLVQDRWRVELGTQLGSWVGVPECPDE